MSGSNELTTFGSERSSMSHNLCLSDCLLQNALYSSFMLKNQEILKGSLKKIQEHHMRREHFESDSRSLKNSSSC